ncbi:MAG: Lrp/AsnC family transcriptional regulator [Pseudomonadota bacterium]|nr:Lrp/AsnC family transcriptional regulator [Pseudomonadota bacterium]
MARAGIADAWHEKDGTHMNPHTMDLDKKDRSIIEALQQDARQSLFLSAGQISRGVFT